MRDYLNKHLLVKKFELTQERYESLLELLHQYHHMLEAEVVHLNGQAQYATDDCAQGIQSFTQKYEKELAQVDDWLQFLKP